WPSRKKSRFSGKNRLKRVRFTCCSSISTWAKSVLTVRSSVMLLVRPYFASMPMSLSILFDVGGDATRLVVRFETPYGFSSIMRDGGGASSPTSVAALGSRWTELFGGVPGGVIDNSEC